MVNLAPLLKGVDSYYAGDKPLARRIERIARDVACGEYTVAQIAQRAKVSEPTIYRLKTMAPFRSRVAALREEFEQRALEDEPLARKGQRIAMLGSLARTLKEQLEANEYVTTLGVSKQGNPIVGFDRARVSEIRQYLSAIADELAEPVGRQAADQLAVSVTMTTADAVTRVQALLSRADPGNPPAGPQGWRGVSSETESVREDGAVLDTEYTTILDAKAVEVKRDAE